MLNAMYKYIYTVLYARFDTTYNMQLITTPKCELILKLKLKNYQNQFELTQYCIKAWQKYI